MALSRINGREDLFVGGVFTLRRPNLIRQHGITHILSVIKYSLDKVNDTQHVFGGIDHLSIDIEDIESENILVHFPKMVRFIESGLYGEMSMREDNNPAISEEKRPNPKSEPGDGDAIQMTSAQLVRLRLTPVATSTRGPTGPQPTGAVLVHCAMGKSRSVSAVIAYLLWKHPNRFGRANPSATPREAVMKALKWVRDSRSIAMPNAGFMSQLEMWWEMGCPAESDGAVEREAGYQSWLSKRGGEDVPDSDWIFFEDLEVEDDEQGQ